ncbi:MAG: methyltransferase domain-containing protein, partial [Anaerolineales bacterium]|nr:methyltransferase domain-containing protein [Anaerolineales bacterium]
MNKENVDALKRNPSGYARRTYKLKNADVYVSADGFHFIDRLDPVEDLPPEIDASQLTGDTAAYIETQLQANERKFLHQAEVLEKYLPLPNAKVLDIGCGGGLFLSLLERRGANVTGIELSDSRAQYAQT